MYRDEFYYKLYKKSNSDRKTKIYYYWRYDENGNRIYRSTGQTNERKADAYVKKLIAEGKFNEVHKSKDITFREFIEKYHFWDYDLCPFISNYNARAKKPYSRELCKSNRDCMIKHILPTFGEIKLSHITKALINNWIIHLPAAANLSNKSANNMLTILYHILETAADYGLLKKDIIIDRVRSLPKNYKTRPAFTTEQITLLFSQAWPNYHAFVGCKLAAFTGMRLGEIRALTDKQVFPDYILVDASWADAEGRKGTKSGKPRVVPISDELYKMLKGIMNVPGLIFSLDGQKPVGEKFFSSALKKRLNELNIRCEATENETSLTFHSFRHFFNSRLVAGGVNGEIIRAIIGHEDEDMTRHYLHLEPSDQKAIRTIQSSLLQSIPTTEQ